MNVVDAVIVGAGITGCGAAHHLARAGLSVVVLERSAPNRGASGRNAGSLHFQLQHQAPELGPEQRRMLRATVPLLREGAAAWRRLSEELEDDLELEQHGGLMIAESELDVARLQEKHAMEQAWGMRTELMDRASVRSALPGLGEQVQAAVFCPEEGHANPRLVTLALARSARRRGAVVLSGAVVTAIRCEGHSYQVRTADGQRWSAPVVLDAAGAWSGAVAALVGLSLPVEFVPLQVSATERTAPSLAFNVQHVGARLSLKQMRDGSFLVGGGWAAEMRTIEGTTPDDSAVRVRYESLARNVAVAVRVLPSLAAVRLLRTWTGLAAWTGDGLPILGESPAHPRFYVACGGNGFTLGPVFAEVLAGLVLGTASVLELSFLSPARFQPAALGAGSA